MAEPMDLYEKKSAASQVYKLKKLIDLRIKEDASMASHLNKFNDVLSRWTAQEIKF